MPLIVYRNKANVLSRKLDADQTEEMRHMECRRNPDRENVGFTRAQYLG